MKQLRGIYPIVFTPFDERGEIDEASLRHIVRFELEGGVDGIGVNGFASKHSHFAAFISRKTRFLARV